MKEKISETQARVLRMVLRSERWPGGEVQLAGDKAAPLLSAARSLERRGLLKSWHSGKYGLTAEGRPYAERALEEWELDRAARLSMAEGMAP